MSVWFVLPSKRPLDQVEPVLAKWRVQGYRIGLWRDPGEAEGFDETLINQPYQGYSHAVNALVRRVLEVDSYAEWIICAGDDIEPDANHSAEEIAEECNEHFAFAWWDKFGGKLDTPSLNYRMTFGVMQPTGDKWGDRNGPYIERVAGSPWMGREFCRRMYQGRGPLCEDYFHMGEDEELQAVATKLGVFWQRPDLIHFHRHWGRNPVNDKLPGDRANMPAFLERANSEEEWRKYKEIFRIRQQLGFPGHEPLEG